MTIQKIHLRELASFIESDVYKNSKYLPISRHRALSHSKNPRALPDDLVLVLVFDEGEMVGYLGVFADDLHFRKADGSYQKEHCGWLSCMWVNPQVRGKGIAKKLINTVFEGWDYRILVTEFTPAAKGLYDRTGQFLDFTKPEGLRCYLRLNLSYLLPAKNPDKWKGWGWWLRRADGFFNFFNNIRLGLQPNRDVVFSYVPEVDEEAWQFIQKHRHPQEILRRNDADLRWMAHNPWLLTGPEDEAAKRYHFSSVANRFNFLHIKVHNQKSELIGFLILSIRDNNLKVPYAYFLPEASGQVAAVIEKVMLEMRLHILTVFHPLLLAHWQKNKGPFFMRRGMQRHYIISKVFEELLSGQGAVRVQDGDADAAFT